MTKLGIGQPTAASVARRDSARSLSMEYSCLRRLCQEHGDIRRTICQSSAATYAESIGTPVVKRSQRLGSSLVRFIHLMSRRHLRQPLAPNFGLRLSLKWLQAAKHLRTLGQKIFFGCRECVAAAGRVIDMLVCCGRLDVLLRSFSRAGHAGRLNHSLCIMNGTIYI